MVQIFRPNGTGAWILRTGELTGEEALPGFSCRVEDLFAGL
jgi:Uma2 family endonuclease